MDSPRHVMIGLPLYSGKIDIPLFHGLASTSQECLERGWKPPYVMFRSTDSVITRARNVLVAHFLQQTDCTDLVMIDGDISWEPGSLTRLCSHPVDLVGGAYRARGEPVGEPEKYILRPLDHELVVNPEHGLMEVEGVGAGFLRITRAGAEKLTEGRKEFWYCDDATAPGLKIYCLFDFEWEAHPNGDGGIYYSEDYTFCRRWRALGEKVWIDPQLTLHHTGEKMYSGKLISFLNRRYLEINPPQPPTTAELAKHFIDKEQAA